MTENSQQDILNLQECLALERTTLANERTFLSYSRTAIMVFVTGITAFHFFPDKQYIFILGWVAISISTVLFFVGLNKYMRRFGSLSKLKSGCLNPYNIKKNKNK
jgi:putative membrane protein